LLPMARADTAAKRATISPEVAFGRVLRRIRESQWLSQEELAARSGYHRTYIGQLERGEKSPSLRTLFALGGTLQISPAEMISKVQQSLLR
jgi:transcriptional regulator with XRE-family HTH domain